MTYKTGFALAGDESSQTDAQRKELIETITAELSEDDLTHVELLTEIATEAGIDASGLDFDDLKTILVDAVEGLDNDLVKAVYKDIAADAGGIETIIEGLHEIGIQEHMDDEVTSSAAERKMLAGQEARFEAAAAEAEKYEM